MKIGKFGLLFICTLAAVSIILPAISSAEEKTKYSLTECIAKALTDNPEIKESKASIAISKSRLDEAKTAYFPQVEALALVGPVPAAEGTVLSSRQDVNDFKKIGPFEKFDLTVIQPIYTFGKITGYEKAAQHGVNVESSKVTEKANETALKVKEYYYGVQLARGIKSVIGDIREKLDKAKKTVEKLLKEGSTRVEESDLLKLKVFSGEVEKYYNEAVKSEELALSVLKATMGINKEAQFDIDENIIKQDSTPLETLDVYIEKAKKTRPEMAQLREGLLARESLIKVAKSDYYPMFFIGAKLSVANADNRTDQKNPFVRDDFNYVEGGVAVGFKWNLGFWTTQAKVKNAQAEYAKLLEKKGYAEQGIPLQVKKAYLEAMEAKNNIMNYREAFKSAKQWQVIASANFDLGVGEAKEIFDALAAYGKTKGEELKAVYGYNIAVGNILYAIGEGAQQYK